MAYWNIDQRDWSGQRVVNQENILLSPKLPSSPYILVEADTIQEAVKKAKEKIGQELVDHVMFDLD